MFIYALCDPQTGVFRYVGKAADPEKRLRHHRNDRSATRKARWIRALAQRGLLPELVILEEVSEEDWEHAERRWIGHFRAIGVDLTNHTDGGEGLRNPSAATRAKLRSLRSAEWSDPEQRERWLAILRAPERRRKIAEALQGKPKAPEHVAKLPQNQPGRSLSEEHRQRISASLVGNQHAKGHIHSNETRAKISVAKTGQKYPNRKRFSEEDKLKRSLALRGRPKSIEWREKIRQGQLKAWAARKAAIQDSNDVHELPAPLQHPQHSPV